MNFAMKDLFSEHSELYQQARPDYSAEIMQAILQQSGKVIAADINLEATQKCLAALDVECAHSSVQLQQLDITNEKQVTELFQSISIDGAVNATYPRNSQIKLGPNGVWYIHRRLKPCHTNPTHSASR